MSWVALAVGVGSAAVSVGTGISQKNKAKKELAALGNAPKEAVPQELLDNQAMARVRATTGLPSEIYNNNQKNIERTQMAAIKNAQDKRLGSGIVAGVQDNTNNAKLNLDAMDAQQRINNEKTLYGVNSQVAAVKRDIYNKDTRNQYWNKYQYAMSLMGQGNANEMQGAQQVIGAVGGAAAGGAFNRLSPTSLPQGTAKMTLPTPPIETRSTANIIKPLNTRIGMGGLSPEETAYAKNFKIFY